VNKADAILKGRLEMILIDDQKNKRKFVLEDADIFYLGARVVSDSECIFYDSFK
jgi:hypothetical protein